MFALDLFNNDHERRLAEGAVDQLEQRRIDDLAMKMDDLVARAKEPAYKKNPAALAALMKEFQKCKAERDSYYKVRTETMGYGRLGETGLPDIADKAAKMARLKQPGKVGTDIVTPQQRVNPNPNKGIIGHAADWLRGKGGPGKEGPTYEDLDEAAEDSKISIARYVYAQIMKALEANLQFDTIYWPQGTMQGPKQEATLSRNQMHFLIQRLVNMSREQRKQFTQKVLADRNATLQWLTSKKIKTAPTMPQPEVQAGQMDLNLPKPVGEARGQKKNSDKVDSPTAQNAEVQNRLRKLRAEYPSATNDVEALVQDEMATQAQVDQILSQQQAEIQQQGSAVAQLNQANQQQDSKIRSLQQQLATAQRDLQQPATKPTVTTPTTTTTQPAPVADKSTSVSGPIYIPEPVTAKDQEIYNKVQDLETELKGKIDAMASWNAVAQKDPQANNELEALRKEVERTRTEIQRQVKKLTKQVKKHTKSLPATDQAPTKNMGAVRRVAPTPQLGQTPTDAGELGRQIGQRAQANKQAKYGKKPTAAMPTDLDIIDVGQASDYLSGLRKRGRAATTVQPQQAELQIEEGTAEQFGQAVRQADLMGRELERDPEWRRLQQQKIQREKNKLRSQAGYGNDADEFRDITNMNETTKKLQQGDPIIVTAPNEFEGKTGEIYDFSPSGTFVIVDLYNHGKHSMHLNDIAYNEYADQEQDDWYDESVAEETEMTPNEIRTRVEKNIPRIMKNMIRDYSTMDDNRFKQTHGMTRQQFYQQLSPEARNYYQPAQFEQEQKPAGWGEFPPKQEITIVPPKKLKSGETYQDQNKYWQSQGQAPIYKTNEVKADPTGSWVVYGGNKVVKFKTHAGAKAYAEKNGGKVASGEHYADKIQKSGVGEAIVASGPSKPLDDRAVRKMVWDTMKINADTGEQALQRALAVLAKKPQSRMVQDLQDKFQSLADRLAQDVAETVADPRAGMADIYRRLAPKIERHRDSFLAGQLYDELENYAELNGAEKEFKQMMNSARNRAHMEYDTNPGGFHNWFWFLPFEDQDLEEGMIKDIDIMRQDLDSMSDLQFLRAHGMNKEQFKYKYRSLLKPAPQQDVPVQESLRPGEYYIHTVYFKDGTKKRIRVTSDEFDVADYYAKRGQTVDRVDYDFQIHSDMSEEFNMPGTTIPLKSVIQGFTVFYNPQTRTISITRGGDSAEAAIEQIRIKQPTMLAFRSAVDRLITKIEDDQGVTEAEKEPTTRQELLNRVDKIQRMMTQERNPANLQILRKELETIKQRYQHLREDNDSEAVERAILNRIMVAHTDLLMQFGPDKVMQAAEEVAYNVGDVDEIGTSDVSAYVHQVKQILGVPEAVNEKWSQKYKSSINCANPKGFSQKAHCAGKKK